MATRDQVMKVCGVMAAAYPGFNLRAETIAVYAELLADLDTDTLAVAAKQAVAESKFFPTVAELRERVIAMNKRAGGAPTAEEAWREVLNAFGRTACTDPQPKFSHAAIDETVRRIGWRDIGMCQEDDVRILFAQFRTTYDRLIERAVDDMRMLPQTREIVSKLAEALSINTLRLHDSNSNGNSNGKESRG